MWQIRDITVICPSFCLFIVLNISRLSRRLWTILYKMPWRSILLVRFMVFKATFNNISVIYHGSRFYLSRKPEKFTDLPQVTDKPNLIQLKSPHSCGICSLFAIGFCVVAAWKDYKTTDIK